MQQLAPGLDTLIGHWWLQSRTLVPMLFQRGFDGLVLLVFWELWKERNRRTFDGISESTSQVLLRVRNKAEVSIAAGYSKLAPLFAVLA
jgi:hypothetical protein